MIKIKRIVAALLIASVVFGTSSVALADSYTAKDYMAEGIRAAYDNMHLIYQGFYDDEGNLEEQLGGYVAIWQEWDRDWNLLSRTYIGQDGEPINCVGGYAKAELKTNDDGGRTICFYDTNNRIPPGVKILFLTNDKAGNESWSEWMEPKMDTENWCFPIGYADLGDKAAGDKYTCTVEIEFENVTGIENKDFWLRAQGAVDGSWGIRNVWNDDLVSLREPPEDRAYKYSFSTEIDDNNLQATTFEIGFRCDYWGSGRFRVRNIEIVKE